MYYKKMKVVILASGYGTRLTYYTDKIPKPMIQVDEKPMLSHIMNIFQSFGHDEFIIAVGHKKEIISGYYKNTDKYKN